MKLQDQDQPKDKAQKMVRVGMAIMAASWGMMVGLAGVTFFSQRARNPAIARAGTVVRLSLVLIIIPYNYGGLANILTAAICIRQLLPALHRRPRLL